MRRCVFAVLMTVTAGTALAGTPPSKVLDMETIMADPDWIGHAVEEPYWSIDGRSLYYRLKRDGSSVRDLYRVDATGGVPQRLDAVGVAGADGPAVYDRAHRQAAFIRHGDVFVRNVNSGSTRQLTRTDADESAPQFAPDGRSVVFRQGLDWYRCTLPEGIAAPVADLKFADDPQAKAPDALGEEQLRRFATLRGIRQDQAAQRADEDALAAADPGRAPKPFWLGDASKPIDSALSPDGRWLLLVLEPKDSAPGRTPHLTRYVTESGYAEPEDVRTFVGRNDPAAQSLKLLDLRAHRAYDLDVNQLPGIHDDPLASIRARTVADLAKAGHADRAQALKAPATRGVRVADEAGNGSIAWSDDGRQLAIELRAIDNKDRWLATVDLDRHRLLPQQREHDDAWINDDTAAFGWLHDGSALWYLSEASGYMHLYVQRPGGRAQALTQGAFEVSQPQLSEDGHWFYLRSNRQAPYSYDVYRVAVGGGALEWLTRYQGVDGFEPSPDGHALAVLHSGPYLLPQLAVADGAGGVPRELTQTMKSAFTGHAWLAPRFVQVPSRHGARPIWAKFYADTDVKTSGRPAVIFVHGAGYLQDVSAYWSHYYREQMFHNRLVQKGYVVLDMDYRASAGYGRDWRTAIYRNMGHPELEDLLDGKAWLVETQHVDPKRVGIYGGSYGGFMTEMALLRAPGEFAAGAALRPVADWTDYNHGYTADILNDPQLDPDAYRVSSPIEYANGLADPLLIAHGLIDNNVLAQDSLRLYQRLIELHKKDFWITLYPLERHDFKHADDWHDEYRRIDELFERYLAPASPDVQAARSGASAPARAK